MGLFQGFVAALSLEQYIEAARRVADRMRDGNDIPVLSAAAPQGFSGFDFTEGSDGDDGTFFRHDRIAAEDIDFILPADILDTAIQFDDIIDFHG